MFRTFLAAVNAYGTPEKLRTDNGPEFINSEFKKVTSGNNACREYTSVHCPKRNGRVQRKLAFVAQGRISAILEFQLMFEGVEFSAKALDYGRMWPEAWT